MSKANLRASVHLAYRLRRSRITFRIAVGLLRSPDLRDLNGRRFASLTCGYASLDGFTALGKSSHLRLHRISNTSQQIGFFRPLVTSNPSQLRLGRYPTTLGFGRMSPRGRNKFLFAGFGWISVTRLLSLQGKTEKRNRLFLHKTAPLCNVLWGIFAF